MFLRERAAGLIVCFLQKHPLRSTVPCLSAPPGRHISLLVRAQQCIEKRLFLQIQRDGAFASLAIRNTVAHAAISQCCAGLEVAGLWISPFSRFEAFTLGESAGREFPGSVVPRPALGPAINELEVMLLSK